MEVKPTVLFFFFLCIRVYDNLNKGDGSNSFLALCVKFDWN